MLIVEWLNYHSNFKISGTSYVSYNEIIRHGYQISKNIGDFLSDWFSDKSYIAVQTSGSTGKPKVISLKKVHVINSAIATGNFLNLKNKSTALMCLPIDYIAGKLMLIRALVLGWDLTIEPSSSNPLKNVKINYDFTAFVPLQLQNSLDKLHHFKCIIVGGGAVSDEIMNKLQDKHPKIYATYGMTETITHIALQQLNKVHLKPSFYHVLPNVDIYIDERNCLVIEASHVSDKVIFTNDVVQLISPKQFQWLGRYDNVINSGGIKLHPEIIEKKLSKIIDSRYFVTSKQDPTLGEKLVLIIEGAFFHVDLNQCNLSRFEYPKEVFFLKKFVETASGKIQRTKTKALLDL